MDQVTYGFAYQNTDLYNEALSLAACPVVELHYPSGKEDVFSDMFRLNLPNL